MKSFITKKQTEYIQTQIHYHSKTLSNVDEFPIFQHLSRQDIKQDLAVIAISAMTKYDPERGSYKTLVDRSLKNGIATMIQSARAERYGNLLQHISLDPLTGEGCDDVDNDLMFNQCNFEKSSHIKHDFYNFYSNLPKSEKKFLDGCLEHFKVHSEYKLKMSDIAANLRTPRPTLYDLQGRIRQKLINAGFENYFRPHADSI